jgi:flagellar hook protein FlgE
MVLKAMYSGVSGLRAEGEALGVIGDNIANVNTVGFKGQRAIFQDVLGHSILAGTSSSLPGSGVRIGDIQQMFTQGTITNTGISTDVALSGDGFFAVKGTVDGISGNFYTRAGQFTLDKDGFLVNPNGLQVQGYAANGDGTFAASISSVKAPTSALPPRQTQAADVVANLDSSAQVPTAAWDAQDPANTANFSDTLTVYDSLGQAHTMDVYFRKTADGTWDWHALVSGDETNPAAPGTNVEVGTGNLTFTTDGALDTITGNTVTVDFLGATGGQAITLNLGSSIAGGGTGMDGITQYASASNVSSHSQDGYAAGDFSGIAIDGQGVVMGLYTNGQKLALSQLSIAKFRSNDGLGRAGQSLWIDTRESGPAAFGVAGSGGRGAASSGAVEMSNVDLAEEFVGLIQHQRSFSANSKTITTADEMLQELIGLKR